MPALNVLVESLADHRGHYTIVESSPASLQDQDVFRKFPEINNSKIIQRVNSLSYDDTRAYLNDNVERIRSWASKDVSVSAVDEAARIFTNYFNGKSHTKAWELLLEAAKESIQDDRGGGTRAKIMRSQQRVARLTTEVSRLQNEINMNGAQGLQPRLEKAQRN